MGFNTPQTCRLAVCSTTIGLMLKLSALPYQDLINKDTVARRSQTCEPAFAFFLDHDAMLLKVTHQNRPPVDKLNIQIITPKG